MNGSEMLATSSNLDYSTCTDAGLAAERLPAMEFGSSPWRISTDVPGCSR